MAKPLSEKEVVVRDVNSKLVKMVEEYFVEAQGEVWGRASLLSQPCHCIRLSLFLTVRV